MPTIARIGRYRVFFYSNEGYERPHVHIEHDDCEAKFWLDPIDLARNINFNQHELSEVRRLVEEHQQEWVDEWHEFHRN